MQVKIRLEGSWFFVTFLSRKK